jgi:hypothetical protein
VGLAHARAAIMLDREEATVTWGLWLLVAVAFGFFVWMLPWATWLGALLQRNVGSCACLA